MPPSWLRRGSSSGSDGSNKGSSSRSGGGSGGGVGGSGRGLGAGNPNPAGPVAGPGAGSPSKSQSVLSSTPLPTATPIPTPTPSFSTPLVPTSSPLPMHTPPPSFSTLLVAHSSPFPSRIRSQAQESTQFSFAPCPSSATPPPSLSRPLSSSSPSSYAPLPPERPARVPVLSPSASPSASLATGAHMRPKIPLLPEALDGAAVAALRSRGNISSSRGVAECGSTGLTGAPSGDCLGGRPDGSSLEATATASAAAVTAAAAMPRDDPGRLAQNDGAALPCSSAGSIDSRAPGRRSARTLPLSAGRDVAAAKGGTEGVPLASPSPMDGASTSSHPARPMDRLRLSIDSGCTQEGSTNGSGRSGGREDDLTSPASCASAPVTPCAPSPHGLPPTPSSLPALLESEELEAALEEGYTPGPLSREQLAALADVQAGQRVDVVAVIEDLMQNEDLNRCLAAAHAIRLAARDFPGARAALGLAGAAKGLLLQLAPLLPPTPQSPRPPLSSAEGGAGQRGFRQLSTGSEGASRAGAGGAAACEIGGGGGGRGGGGGGGHCSPDTSASVSDFHVRWKHAAVSSRADDSCSVARPSHSCRVEEGGGQVENAAAPAGLASAAAGGAGGTAGAAAAGDAGGGAGAAGSELEEAVRQETLLAIINLTADCTVNKTLIPRLLRRRHAVHLLVRALSVGPSATRQLAAEAVFSLSLEDCNKSAFAAAGAVEPLVALLAPLPQKEARPSREGSAAWSCSSSSSSSYVSSHAPPSPKGDPRSPRPPSFPLISHKSVPCPASAAAAGARGCSSSSSSSSLKVSSSTSSSCVSINIGSIPPPALAAASCSPSECRRMACKALYSLTTVQGCSAAMVAAGAVPHLVDMLKEPKSQLAEKAALLLKALAMTDEGREAIMASDAGLERLVEEVESGTAGGKECAVAALLEVAKSSAENRQAVELEAPLPGLTALAHTGTRRARETARKLHKLLQR